MLKKKYWLKPHPIMKGYKYLMSNNFHCGCSDKQKEWDWWLNHNKKKSKRK